METVESGNVYPNPFADHLTIQQKGDFSYQIFHLEGREMESVQGMNVAKVGSQLEPSLYILKIQGEQEN